MSKRYYLCDIIGDGLEPETAFRPAVAEYANNWAASIPTDSNGKPSGSSVLTIVAEHNHAALHGKPGVDQMPDFPLDGKVSAINANAKRGMDEAISNRNIPVDTNSADGYRTVLDQIGKSIDPHFDIDNFDIADI